MNRFPHTRLPGRRVGLLAPLGVALLSAVTVASCTQLVTRPASNGPASDRPGAVGAQAEASPDSSRGDSAADESRPAAPGTLPTESAGVVPVPTQAPDIATPPTAAPRIAPPPLVRLIPNPLEQAAASVPPVDPPTSAPPSSDPPTSAPPSSDPATSSPPTESCLAIDVLAAAFAADSADLSPDVDPALAGLLPSLLASQGPIGVTGHTDRHPTDYPGGNQGLSDDRASAVADLLVRLGVPEERLDVSGRAENEPRNTASTTEADTENRRVEIRVSC